MNRKIISTISCLLVLISAAIWYFWIPQSEPVRGASLEESSEVVFDRTSMVRGKLSEFVQRTNLEATALLPAEVERIRDPSDSVLGFDGILSYQTIEELGLSKVEALNVQSSITSLTERLTSAARSKTSEITLEDDSEASDATFFRMEPYTDKAQAIVEEFRVELADKIGPELGDRLTSSITQSGKFGDFGKYEVIVGFEDEESMTTEGDEASMRNFLVAHYLVTDPKTGESITWNSIQYREFIRRFGDVFAVSEQDLGASLSRWK